MRALALLLALAASPAAAQKIDCNNLDGVQFELNECAALAFEQADAALNAVYAEAVARAREADAGVTPGGLAAESGPGFEESLREAQRAWVAFRDANCLAETAYAWGGSMHPMVYSGCLANMTLDRTAALRAYVESPI